MPKVPPVNQSDLGHYPPLGPDVKALLVWPKIPASFWSFKGVMGIIPQKAAIPPLGLITVAALCPEDWTIKLIDCAVDDLLDHDLLWADLVMVSAMHVQKDDLKDILLRARRLGRRTIIGGPFASSQPDVLLEFADHVVVGEPDEIFDQIAHDLETGSAKRLYEISAKPDVNQAPVPRFDLLQLDRYASMPIQFSRGCPFQCEFCDIITIYGRKPRTKRPEQVLAELDTLFHLGWRKEIFIVDDNFIGNHKLALALVQELEVWQRMHDFPFPFYTEASIDLARRPPLIDAMVRANFFYVFVGVESPSKASLIETRKFQNLRQDPLEAIRFIQSRGLWVTGGFIVGFDSDPEDIFEQQVEFIEATAIPWAMLGFLQAPPTTPLFERMLKEGRLIQDSQVTSNFDSPNFRTALPRVVLLKGVRDTLATIYDPEAFYQRAFRSLRYWNARSCQRAPRFPVSFKLATVLRSMWCQGIRSPYRQAYWKFLAQLLGRWGRQPQKLWLGFTLLISGHHFIPYASQVVAQIEAEIRKLEDEQIARARAA